MEAYSLALGERVIFKESHVKSSNSFASYTDVLMLTSRRLVHMKVDIFNNYYDVVTYPVKDIEKVNVTMDLCNESQLQFQYQNQTVNFSFQGAKQSEYEKWAKAILEIDKYEAGKYKESDYTFSKQKKMSSETKVTQSSIYLEDNSIAKPTKEERKIGKVVGDFCEKHDINAKSIGSATMDALTYVGITPFKILKSVYKASKKESFIEALDVFKDNVGIKEVKKEIGKIKDIFHNK